MLLQIFSVFIAFGCISNTFGLYFHIGETERKCFIEEIPDETMVVGNYKVEVFDRSLNDFVPAPPQGFGIHFRIFDPNRRVMLSRTYAADGRFTFTAHSAGEHVMCLHSNSSAWFGGGKLRIHLGIELGEGANDYVQIAAKGKLTELQLRVRQLQDQVEQITKEQNFQRRVHLKIDIGEGANDYSVIAQKEKLTELQLRIRQLIDKSEQIKREQDFQRYREERFRQTSESTNQRVLWWSIAQTVILLLTGFWQMRHLKGFFEAKKLV